MKNFYFLFFLLCLIQMVQAQQNIGIGTTTPDSSALLDISSTNKGVLIPRMTYAQRIAIPQPAEGLCVYQTDSISGIYNYLDGAWMVVVYQKTPGIMLQRLDSLGYTGNSMFYPVTKSGIKLRLTMQAPAGGLGVNYYNLNNNCQSISGYVAPYQLTYPAQAGEGYQGILALQQNDTLRMEVGEQPQTSINGVLAAYPDGTPGSITTNNQTLTYVCGSGPLGGSITCSCPYSDQFIGGSSGGSTRIFLRRNGTEILVASIRGGNGGTFSQLVAPAGQGVSTFFAPGYFSGITPLLSTGSNAYIVMEEFVSNNILNNNISASGGGSASNSGNDNLGNHIATQDLILDGFSIRASPTDSGIRILPSGDVQLGGGSTHGSRLTINSANTGGGYLNWIATDAGAMTGDRVVSGLLQGKATLGAHTNALNAWSTLYLNPGGDIVLPALSGIGSRYLTVNDTGRLVATMLPQAGPNSEGVLSSADWNSFENKFNLPVLTSGSVLISNGNSITENNANLFWNSSTNRLGIGTNVPNTPITVNSSNSGSGYTDWVAGNFGAQSGNRVVLGLLDGKATIGSHNHTLNAWTNLYINPGGAIILPSMAGIGTRLLQVDDTGRISTTQIQLASAFGDGLLSATDWNTFHNKFDLPALNAGSILFSNGSSISQNNGQLFWNESSQRLGIGTNNPNTVLTVNSTNPGTGTADWVAGNFGAQAGDRLVLGLLNGKATLGAHGNALGSWADLYLNSGGNIYTPSLAGNQSRILQVNNNGQLVPSALYTNSAGDIGLNGIPNSRLDIGEGAVLLGSAVNNNSPRPGVGSSRISGEIAAYGLLNGTALTPAADDGLLRLSAGGGTTPASKSFIDLTGFSYQTDMDRNIILGTSGTEAMRIDAAGNIGIGTNQPTNKLEVNGKAKLNELQVTGGNPQAGMVLTSDMFGNASWQSPGSGPAGPQGPQGPAGPQGPQGFVSLPYYNSIALSFFSAMHLYATGIGSIVRLQTPDENVTPLYCANTHSSPTRIAAYFDGGAQVTGNLSKSGGTFKIDHPQDPANKYLYHSFVESPDMLNIYNGNITTDANGDAVVNLPEYFEALNIEFRYQLTVIGTFAQAIIQSEIKDNQFTIKTSQPNVKVSWQVTGVRNDAWAQANRVVPEVKKEPANQGRYLHPELFGQSAELRILPPGVSQKDKR